MDQAPTSPVPQSKPSRPLRFSATRGEFLKLLLVNAFLTIITLGIYRFWAKTKVRRYLWSNVRFLDDPFEYTGTGTELFIGFLIVLAVLFPLGVVYSTIQTVVPPDHGWAHIALEVAYYTVLFALIQIGFYRAWRYRMSRTRWRGIRLGLDGSSWTYLKLAMGWSIVTVLTLGLAYPWMQIELWRYQMSHTRVGTFAFTFDGDAKSLLKPWLIACAPAYAVIAALAISAIWLGINLDESAVGSLHVNVDEPLDKALILGLVPIVGLAFALLFWFNVRLDRTKISGLTIGRSELHSTLPFGRLLGYAATAIGVIALPVAVLLLLAVSDASNDAIVMLFIFLFLTFFLIFPLIWAVVYSFEYVKCLVETTTVSNPTALEELTQSAADDLKTGEGLADALDIGGL